VKLSMSSLGRASICAASAVLPRIETQNPDSEAGIAGHRFLELVPRIGAEEALTRVAEEYREMCAALQLDKLPLGPGHRQEVAFYYDVLTGKAVEIGESIDRAYPALQDWQIPGTADVVRVDPGVSVYVGDWKFGFGHDLHTAPIEENLQLRSLALAAARAYGVQRARIEIWYLPEHRPATFDLDAFALAAHAAQLRELYERVIKVDRAHRAGMTLNVRAGLHCGYCPALQHCPSTQALAAQLVATPDTIERDTKALLTKDNAPLAYERWRQMKAVTDAVGNALCAWARESPITTKRGTVYGPVSVTREHVDGNVAFHVIQQLHGDVVAGKAVEIATSKAAIERAVKPVVEKGGGAAAIRRVLQAIEAEGGITAATTEQMKEHRPKST